MAVLSVRLRWCISCASFTAGRACALRRRAAAAADAADAAAASDAASVALRPQSAQSVPRTQGTSSVRPHPLCSPVLKLTWCNAQFVPPKIM